MKTRLVTSVRIRLVQAFQPGAPAATADPGGLLTDALALLADHGLVATIEAGASEPARVAELARRFPQLPPVLDHFGWPEDLSERGLRGYLASLRQVADQPNVATRIDAIGTIFRAWDTNTLRPWLRGVVEVFGPRRCMLGSDLRHHLRPVLRRRPAAAVRRHRPAPLRQRQVDIAFGDQNVGALPTLKRNGQARPRNPSCAGLPRARRGTRSMT